VKLRGIKIGTTHKPSKDGKRLVLNEKRYDVSTELKRKNSTKVRAVKPSLGPVSKEFPPSSSR
jgi:hypothetical protein